MSSGNRAEAIGLFYSVLWYTFLLTDLQTTSACRLLKFGFCL